ncbi:hypothetical protein GQ55_7G089200 [Panicum hallii var. hallii]|uniref:Uncharacterized protein n=1 Tax=Panicum hallii var. hallii TaxID=1504633 RepID=A0A2T7CTD8_9POAL|nr:hypothetical protein GQ55_7G089200 [Panicum hallii var. hallii]
MEKDLMKTGDSHILRCAEDLSMKAFVAARCASRQLEAEGASSSSNIDTLEAKITDLEREKVELEKKTPVVERSRNVDLLTEAKDAHDQAKMTRSLIQPPRQPLHHLQRNQDQ